MTTWRANFFISKYVDSSRNPIMKMAKPSFYCDRMVCLFAKVTSRNLVKLFKRSTNLDFGNNGIKCKNSRYQITMKPAKLLKTFLYSIYMHFYL